MQSQYEVADVLHHLGKKVENIGLNNWQLRTLSAIKKCRTSALGGHIDACDECGVIRISYNSCRNRHCPKCQGKSREDWMAARSSELLPVPYFHVVFTLPDSINPLAIHQPKLVYDTLFDAAWETLAAFAKHKGLKMGMIAVLHTWGQNLSLHPHLHCIVPGGGVDKEGNWKNIRADGKFLFPVKALSKVFQAKYCQKLKAKDSLQYNKIRQGLWQKNWVVYAKKPFGNAASVLEYLGRYTHKIAISNHRIMAMDDKTVTFSYKNYRQNGIKKQMTLTQEEFIRRFALHILPKRFVKIRHYGFLSSTWKRKKLKILQKKLGVKPPQKIQKESAVARCTNCGIGQMLTVAIFQERGPPIWLSEAGLNPIPCKY
jgi:hypothetical protein